MAEASSGVYVSVEMLTIFALSCPVLCTDQHSYGVKRSGVPVYMVAGLLSFYLYRDNYGQPKMLLLILFTMRLLTLRTIRLHLQ